jgi:hypothetical protein
MKFSKNELNVICQNAAPTKAETLAGIKEIVSVTADLMTKLIMENAIRRLERIPEPECSQFIASVKAQFLTEQNNNSIRQRLAAAKAQEQILQGHDLSGKERFRFYLSDEGYRNAKRSEQEGEIKIKSHAAVVDGKLYPDKKPKQQER